MFGIRRMNIDDGENKIPRSELNFVPRIEITVKLILCTLEKNVVSFISSWSRHYSSYAFCWHFSNITVRCCRWAWFVVLERPSLKSWIHYLKFVNQLPTIDSGHSNSFFIDSFKIFNLQHLKWRELFKVPPWPCNKFRLYSQVMWPPKMSRLRVILTA